MDEGIVLLLGKLKSFFRRVIIDIAVKHHLCAEFLCPVDLYKRCCGRHYDHCLYPVHCRRIGHTLCMVACGRGYDTGLLFFIGQSANLVKSPSYLVGSGHLHVLGLQIDLVSGLCRKIITENELGLACYVFNDLAGFLKAVKGKHPHIRLCRSFLWHIGLSLLVPSLIVLVILSSLSLLVLDSRLLSVVLLA